MHGFVNAGTRFRKFWLQGGFAWLSSDYFPLPAVSDRSPCSLIKTGATPGKPTIRDGSKALGHRTIVTNIRLPTQSRRVKRGNPPYAGTDPAVRPRFWQWPQWDKESFYFIGNKSLGEASYVRARLYYDKFDNLLKAYDNANYNTQTLPSSFTSPYDDDTYGTTTEFGTRIGNRQTVKGSFYFKDDTHREGNLGEPERSFRDQTYSFGVQDYIQITTRTSAILGFSADHLDVLNAENLVSGSGAAVPEEQCLGIQSASRHFSRADGFRETALHICAEDAATHDKRSLFVPHGAGDPKSGS